MIIQLHPQDMIPGLVLMCYDCGGASCMIVSVVKTDRTSDYDEACYDVIWSMMDTQEIITTSTEDNEFPFIADELINPC